MIEADIPKAVVGNYNESTSFNDLLLKNGLRLQEQTPTPSPLQQIDEENIRLIQSPVNHQEFRLQEPKIVVIGALDLSFFFDIGFAVIADDNNRPYAIVHNVNCLSETFTDKDLLGQRVIQEFESNGFLSGPGTIRGVKTWIADKRLDYMDASVLIEDLSIPINGTNYSLPVLELKGISMDGIEEACPTLIDRALGAVNIGDLAEKLGEALGNITTGIEEGFQEGRDN